MRPPFHAFPLDPAKARRAPFAAPARPSPAVGKFLLPLALLILVGGCASGNTDQNPTITDEGRSLFGTSPSAGNTSKNPGSTENAWSIVIVAFRGPGQEAAANAGLARARTAGGLRDAYSRREGNSTVIAYGRYPGPDSAEAQSDLKRIRELNVEGGRPFAGAVLAPPAGAGTGRVPELDLRRVTADFGANATYTLQIAAYGRDDRKPPQSDQERAEFVRMAEDAAAKLRREGDQAFYYHGPNMSLVTIGVFGPEDFDPQRPEYRSDRLRAAEEAYPDNLLNGKGINVRVPGAPAGDPKSWRKAKSFLIVIPKEQ